MSRNCLDRYWEKVDVRGPDECWPWTASALPAGYGMFTLGAGRRVYAHRFGWELAHAEPIPAGKAVLHSCDKPPCVNPRHLRVGTRQDNVDDMTSRKRHMFGDRHVHAKLSSTLVRDLVSEYRSGARPRRLAEKLGVSEAIVHDVLNGNTWTEVTGGPVRVEGRAGTILTEGERARVLQHRRGGLTQVAIAKRMNRSVSSIRDTLYAAGIIEPRVGRPRKITSN